MESYLTYLDDRVKVSELTFNSSSTINLLSPPAVSSHIIALLLPQIQSSSTHISLNICFTYLDDIITSGEIITDTGR
jgi:hypothetical protein